jgi:predicted patatin/cPLA2 family phospholipase
MRPCLPPATAAAGHPLYGVLLARTREGTRPRHRRDPHVVALAVEGGGMRGAVAAGMCLVLEAAGLMPGFDRVYGCSSGAITGAYAAAGQAPVWATSFEDCACREFIDPARAFRGGPLVDLEFLFREVIGRRRPLSEVGLSDGPEVHAVAVASESAELRVLSGFADRAELLGALRASCAIPVLAGAPPTYRGETLFDGGLLEPIPYRAALADGATHVLVLRSHDAAYRGRRQDRVAERVLARAQPELAALLHSCSRRYHRDAAELQRLEHEDGPVVRQITVPAGTRLVSRFSTDRARIAADVRLGAVTMATALYGARATLFWQPFPELLAGGRQPRQLAA